MSLLTINGFPIIRGQIYLPRVGVWRADVSIDDTSNITGAVTIATGDKAFSLTGFVYRSGLFTNTLSMRVLGGVGGLSPAPSGVGPVLPPKFYQGATVGLILKDTLTACGEKLSGTSDTTVLGTVLQKWVRIVGSGKQAITRLASLIGFSWRVLADGTVWVGTDTYPAAPSVQFDIMDRWFGEGRIAIGCAQPFLFPGTTLTISASATQGTQRVSYVVHEIEPHSITAEVWFE